MCQYVRFQVRGLGEFLVATVEGTDVRTIACVYPNVGPVEEINI